MRVNSFVCRCHSTSIQNLEKSCLPYIIHSPNNPALTEQSIESALEDDVNEFLGLRFERQYKKMVIPVKDYIRQFYET